MDLASEHVDDCGGLIYGCSMKLILALSLVLICGRVIAEEPQTIITIKGDHFEKAMIVSSTPGTVTIMHSTGVAVVPFEELPESIQKQYGYDRRKAEEWRAREIVAEHQRAAIEAEARKKEAIAAWRREGDEKERHARAIQETIELGRAVHDGEVKTVYDPATRRFYRSPEEANRAREEWLRFLKGGGSYPDNH